MKGRPPVAVEVLICGSPDRADDGAPIAASELLLGSLPPDVAMRVVGQLNVDDLLAIPPAAGVVIVDAATGIDPGAIVHLGLDGLIGRRGGIRPRSSHSLGLPEVVGLAEMIRGRPLRGRIVAIGAAEFGLGQPFSPPVAAALPLLSDAVIEAVRQVRPRGPGFRPGNGPDGPRDGDFRVCPRAARRLMVDVAERTDGINDPARGQTDG